MNGSLEQFDVEYSYPVRFTEDLFSTGNPTFLQALTRTERDRQHRILVVVDANVAGADPRLVPKIRSYCANHSGHLHLVRDPVLVPGGEVVKNDPSHVFRLVELVSTLGIDRQSFMVVIGGGAVLDMACFAAAIAHRGVRAIRVPTTSLSQGDSGVGVKNAINLHGKKNFIGTFEPPFGVLIDFTFLETLSFRDKIAGLAEAVKVSAIRDGEFFASLEAGAALLAAADRAALADVIRRSAERHLEHIRTSGDPFEHGSARPLDFGHWSAHKLESLTNYRLRHGEAVAIGLGLDTLYSVKAGHLAPRQGDRVLGLLTRLGFNLWDDALLFRDGNGEYRVLEGLTEFREHLGGQLHITLLREIGEGFEVTEMDGDIIRSSIDGLKRRFAPPGDDIVRTAAAMSLG
jgi:3-dehydroquinate synthase